MDEEQRVDMMEKSLERHLGWIAAANDRVGTAMTLSLAMLGVLAAVLPAAPSALTWWLLIPGLAATTLLLLSLGMCALVVFPRTDGPKSSGIFFGKVAGQSPDVYAKSVKAVTRADYLDDLVQQVHVNACIAALKFQWVQNAMKFLFLAVIPWAVAVYILYGVN